MKRFFLLTGFLFAAGLAIAEPVIISSGAGGLSGSGSGFGATTPFAATGTSTGRSLSDRAADVINIKDGYGTAPGARGAVEIGGDVSCTSGSPNVTVSSANFTTADVGKLIYVADCATGPVTLISTIVTVTDATHVVLAHNATRTFANAPKRVVYGYDDAAAISAIMQQVRARNGTTAINSHPVSVYFPVGSYIISAAPVDLTDQQQLDIDAYGVTFYCATNGAPCFDAYGFYNGKMRGFTMLGDSARPPTYAVQIGRYKQTGAYGLNQFHGLFLTGHYTRAVWYNSAAEVQTFFGGTFESLSPGATAFVGDGNNLHTLWPAPSTYVTISTTDGEPFSNSQNTFIGTRFRVEGDLNTTAIFLAHAKTWQFINCYIVSRKYGINLYNVPGGQAGLSWSGAFDGPPLSYVFVERDSSTTVDGIMLNISGKVVPGSSIFGTTDLATIATIKAGSVRYESLQAGAKLFDRVEDWAYTGSFTSVIVREDTPVLPAGFVGSLDEYGQEFLTYNTASISDGQQRLTDATGTITQNPYAKWIQFDAWGAGGPGGSGIACGAGISCSGGSGGGAGAHLTPTARMLWSDLGVTTCTYAIGQSIAGGAGGVGGITTITCGSLQWRATGGGAGGPGVVATLAAGGGGGTVISAGGAASGITPGAGGTGGGGAGGTTAGIAGASAGGGGGGGSSAVGAGAGAGASALGAAGGGGGGGCNVGAVGAGASGGATSIGFVSTGNGRSPFGTSGSGGAGGDGSITAGGVGGAGGTPGGGGGGGGSGCNGTGTLGVGGASGGGMIVVWQGN